MGVCLGMLGAGGSILAMPVLVYLFHLDPISSAVYASLIVGIASASGAVKSIAGGMVHRPMLVQFGLPLVLGACLARICLNNVIPNVIFCTSSITFTKQSLVMWLLSGTMLCAGISMWSKSNDERVSRVWKTWLLIPIGILVGMLTGAVGVGGGFLILPALVLISGLDLPRAVGTSLSIIAIKSLASVLGDFSSGIQLNTSLLVSLSVVSIPSVLLGRWLNERVQALFIKRTLGFMFTATAGVMMMHLVAQLVAA